jgi:hypothetical protein
MSRPTFSRRAALLQLASIPITLSLAKKLAAGPSVAPPKRLVIFMANNGTKRCNFWPAPPTSGASTYPITDTPILDTLFTNDGVTDNGLRAKTNLIRGLTVTSNVNTTGNQHDLGFARMFTGAQLMPTPDGAPWGGAASIDQIVANDWNVQSLTTAVYCSQLAPFPKRGFEHRLSFSYVAPQRLNLPYIDPLTAFANTFPQTGDPNIGRRLASRRSVLDAVAGSLAEVAGRLGPDDNHKLDFHLTAVRDAETRLGNLLGGQCPGVVAPPDFKSLGPGFANNEIDVETYVPNMLEAMVTLMGAALKCGLTRVSSLQLGYAGQKWMFGWEGIDMNHHDDIAHADGLDGPGTTPAEIATTSRVTIINQYYASLVRKLALDLASTPEAGGSMLDNTLVIWSNEIGRGDHSMSDIPVVFLGLVGNGIQRGGLVHDVAAAHAGVQQPHNVLGYHALNALGHETAGWGDIADMSPYAIPGF